MWEREFRIHHTFFFPHYPTHILLYTPLLTLLHPPLVLIHILLHQLLLTCLLPLLVSLHLSETFIREGIYLFRVGKIIENVVREKEKLISNHEFVLKKVEATNKTEKVNDAVLDWLNDVEKLMEEEENMEMEILKVLCTSLDSERRYRFYNEMLKKIKTLNTTCEFEPFSSPIPSLGYFSFGNFVCFKSTKVASDQLLETLQDDNCYIIGLYGKQGSGKTKLVKAVGEKAKVFEDF